MPKLDKKRPKHQPQQADQPSPLAAHELTDEQLQQVTGGHSTDTHPGGHPGSPVAYPTGPV